MDIKKTKLKFNLPQIMVFVSFYSPPACNTRLVDMICGHIMETLPKLKPTKEAFKPIIKSVVVFTNLFIAEEQLYNI
jgi:hypothetical protein